MAPQSSLESAWLERDALRTELENARQEIAGSALSMKDSLNVGARARAFVRERPMATAIASVAVGAFATRLLPALLFRKTGLLSRVSAEMAKGIAGMALPFVLNRISRFRRPSAPYISSDLAIVPEPPTKNTL